MGLDRVPEVRTLRGKLKYLPGEGQVEVWAGALSQEWMEADPEAAGVLYVDGHVRVYHGSKTKLPRRYVSRERLCLRGMSDYEQLQDRLASAFRDRAKALVESRYEEDDIVRAPAVPAADLKLGKVPITCTDIEVENPRCRLDALERCDGQCPLGTFHYCPVSWL